MSHIFIRYSHQDSDYAQRLANHLAEERVTLSLCVDWGTICTGMIQG